MTGVNKKKPLKVYKWETCNSKKGKALSNTFTLLDVFLSPKPNTLQQSVSLLTLKFMPDWFLLFDGGRNIRIFPWSDGNILFHREEGRTRRGSNGSDYSRLVGWETNEGLLRRQFPSLVACRRRRVEYRFDDSPDRNSLLSFASFLR